MTKMDSEDQGQLLPSEQIIHKLLRECELQGGAPESEIRGQRASR